VANEAIAGGARATPSLAGDPSCFRSCAPPAEGVSAAERFLFPCSCCHVHARRVTARRTVPLPLGDWLLTSPSWLKKTAYPPG
jgi:hypothetical protein